MAVRVIAVVLLAWALIVPAGAAAGQPAAPVYKGRAVADVLRDLQATRNLTVVFSSERVLPTLRVLAEPRAGQPRAIAVQILEPHGLGLEEGPGGTLIVVARPRRRQKATPQEPPPDEAIAPPPVDPMRITERVDVTERSAGNGVVARSRGIEPAEMREMAGSLDNVLQSLQVLPGVAATNDKEGKLAVRGGSPEHNLILLDGVQIHDPQRFGEFTTSLFNPATAASITLDPSGLDARLGGRLSSVVSVDTRDGTTERALAASGSLGLTSGDVLVEGRLPGSTTGSWWATARGTYYRVLMNRFRDGVMPSFVDGQAKVTLHPTARTRLTLFGLVGRETLLDLERDEDPNATPVVTASNKGVNRIAAGTFRWMPSSRASSTTTLSAYSRASRYVDRHHGILLFDQRFDRDVRVRDLAVRHQLLYALAGGRLIDAGVDLHHVRSSWRMQSVKVPDWWRGIGPTTWGEMVEYTNGPIASHLRRTQAGSWLQLRLDAGRLVTLEPGVRVDWNSYTGEAAWQPRLRASWVFGRTAMWAGFSTQAQTPSHESLQGFQYFQLAADGSQGLRNERMQQIVVGAERPIGGGLGVRIEAYVRQFDRLLVQRQETEAEHSARLSSYVIPADVPPDTVDFEYRPTVFPESTGRGRATGLEVVLRRDRGRATGWIGYTLARSTRDLYGFTVPSDFDRTHALSAVGSLSLTRRLRASATYYAASGFPVTPVLREVYFTQELRGDGTRVTRSLRHLDGSLITSLNPFMRRLSSINRDRLPGYSRLDGRLTFTAGKHWEIYGEVLNALNKRNHRQQLIDVENGKPVSLGGADIYETFGRLPSFGMRVTF